MRTRPLNRRSASRFSSDTHTLGTHSIQRLYEVSRILSAIDVSENDAKRRIATAPTIDLLAENNVRQGFVEPADF